MHVCVWEGPVRVVVVLDAFSLPGVGELLRGGILDVQGTDRIRLAQKVILREVPGFERQLHLCRRSDERPDDDVTLHFTAPYGPCPK